MILYLLCLCDKEIINLYIWELSLIIYIACKSQFKNWLFLFFKIKKIKRKGADYENKIQYQIFQQSRDTGRFEKTISRISVQTSPRQRAVTMK